MCQPRNPRTRTNIVPYSMLGGSLEKAEAAFQAGCDRADWVSMLGVAPEDDRVFAIFDSDSVRLLYRVPVEAEEAV